MAKSFKTLEDKMDPERIARNEIRANEILAQMPLQELRRSRALSQVQLAKTLNVKQANVSKIERRTDINIKTLRGLVSAMGGELHIIAQFPDGAVEINQFADLKTQPVGSCAHLLKA